MNIKKIHILGIIFAVVILGVDIFFLKDTKIFSFIIGLCFVIAFLPFVVSLALESSKDKENNEMFLEFSRNLAESVKAGTPISKGILNLRNKNYGSLTPNIQKLANQISLGIPVKTAFDIFAREVGSSVVKRAITLIGEAERAGGEIESILDSVANSVSEIEELKKVRRASIYNLVVQGYIIFFVFIMIILIMQYKILPMTSDITSAIIEKSSAQKNLDELTKPLLYLLLTQGFFTGLVIGKLAEGSNKAGIKHSFIMVALALLTYTGVKIFF